MQSTSFFSGSRFVFFVFTKCCATRSLFKGTIQEVKEPYFSTNEEKNPERLSAYESFSARVFSEDDYDKEYHFLFCKETTNL